MLTVAVWMLVVWSVCLALLGVIGGVKLGAWSSRENGRALGKTPPPEGCHGRCAACGSPYVHALTFTKAKERGPITGAEVSITWPGVPVSAQPVPASPPAPPRPALSLVTRDEEPAAPPPEGA